MFLYDVSDCLAHGWTKYPEDSFKSRPNNEGFWADTGFCDRLPLRLSGAWNLPIVLREKNKEEQLEKRRGC